MAILCLTEQPRIHEVGRNDAAGIVAMVADDWGKDKAAAENASVLLKLADLNAIFYTDSNGKITVYVQPYEVWRTKYGGGWVVRSLSNRHYTSIEGMQKGISEIIKRKTDVPSYLELPEPDPRSKRFNMPSKRKTADMDICRMIGSQ